MAHETAVHRIDAEVAAGQPVGPIRADLAVDGVGEALAVFLDHETHAWHAEYQDDLTDWGDRWLLVSAGVAGWRVTVRPGLMQHNTNRAVVATGPIVDLRPLRACVRDGKE
jgi:hypothetical protein